MSACKTTSKLVWLWTMVKCGYGLREFSAKLHQAVSQKTEAGFSGASVSFELWALERCLDNVR